jgi:hypothetical protein
VPLTIRSSGGYLRVDNITEYAYVGDGTGVRGFGAGRRPSSEHDAGLRQCWAQHRTAPQAGLWLPCPRTAQAP